MRVSIPAVVRAAARHLPVFVLAAVSASAAAQSGTAYPVKPLRLVVPYSPGASNDTLSRATGEAMSPILGQPIVIDNRPGAGGMIGAEHVARYKSCAFEAKRIEASSVRE